MADLGVITLVYAVAATLAYLVGRADERRKQREGRDAVPHYTGTAVDVARFMADQVARHGGNDKLLFTTRVVEVDEP